MIGIYKIKRVIFIYNYCYDYFLIFLIWGQNIKNIQIIKGIALHILIIHRKLFGISGKSQSKWVTRFSLPLQRLKIIRKGNKNIQIKTFQTSPSFVITSIVGFNRTR